MTPKLPVSVLVVVHTDALDVLLLERASRPGYWQSVTGSLDRLEEPLADAARRELQEETGIAAAAGRLDAWNVVNVFEIFAEWRHRFAAGTTHNTEHVFGFRLPGRLPVVLDAQEHTAYAWRPWREAADQCFSWSNQDAIRMLPARSAPA
ncbi:MAG TPA: dihydroneopterin triphosphate diphosphatase [Burkholderiales bacterium]|jgi:dATP pyrophosphohydrolase|nr:dihydroneopterin triphosphate diphosphatase [Burkholderiales bacterium]